MNEVLKDLKPEKIWFYFSEILKIPRASKKEEHIREYLVNFGKKHNFETLVDETGNVLIRKNATKGYEDLETVVLQSHMDMVCEKNGDSKHNFETDPIEVKVEDGWLKAKDTTLGADNGIGVAAELAILASDNIEHGSIECLFTVDEETGLTGAFGLKPNFFKGKILLNFDSEDDGQFFIGCAGGIDTLINYAYKREKISENTKTYKLFVKGLKGGHSGDDINKGHANAILLLTEFLYKYTKDLGLRIAELDGGNLRNAIAREAFALVCVEPKHEDKLKDLVNTYLNTIKNEYKSVETNMDFTAEVAVNSYEVFSSEDQEKLINAILCCPHGVLRMSADIANFVETSTNLASVKTLETEIIITTSQRSSVESAKYTAANKVAACFKLIGAKVKHGDGYPGWKPNPNSPIVKIIGDTFKELFKEEPLVLAIHAGLECGLFEEKYPGLDMVSYGPTMRGVHSPDEKLKIDTVSRFWDLTLEVLKRIPKK